MTINQHISMVRLLMKINDTDDTPFTDEAIYLLFNSVANKLNKDKYTKEYKVSDWNKSTFCIELEQAKSHNCECIAVGCDVLKTVYKIPKAIVKNNKDLIKFFTLDWTEIPIILEQEQETNQLDDMWKGKTTSSITNRKGMIWNNLDLKAIQVQGVFEDITDWEGVQLCDSDGEKAECFSIDTIDYPLDGDLTYVAYKMMFDILRIPFSLPEDMSNDSSTMK